jgi:thiazole synthase
MVQNERLKIGPYEFTSRLLMGTGKYTSLDIQGAAIDVSETEILTFAIRRLPLDNPDAANFLERLDLKKYKLLPNTAGCYTVDEAVRVARLAKASGLCDMIKVEVIGDPKTLLPDPIGTLEATILNLS